MRFKQIVSVCALAAMLMVPSVGFNMSDGQESEPAERQTAGGGGE
jgi:hypothetical protein